MFAVKNMNSNFWLYLAGVVATYYFLFHGIPLFRRLLRGKVSYIDPKDLDEKIKAHEDLLMIDIRPDFNDKMLGYINGSVSLPFETFMHRIAETADDLAGFKNVPVVIIGLRDENKVFLAYKTLKNKGFVNVSILNYGITQWLRVGLPTVRPHVQKDS